MLKIIQTGSRIILGLIYAVFGGMGLATVLGFMQMPAPQGMPEAAIAFMQGMMGTGYFFPVLKLTETVFGLLLLFNVGAPVALVILAPVTLHIILYHVFLTPGAAELALPAAMGLAQVVAMSAHWGLYRPLFK